MLFTRSIRRKMVFGFVLLASMLAASSLIGLCSVHWYYSAIRSLDFSVNEMPRRADLDAAVGALFEPLQYSPSIPPIVQQREFANRLVILRAEVAEFRRKMDALPPTDAAFALRPVVAASLGPIDAHLHQLGIYQNRLSDPAQRQTNEWLCRQEVAALMVRVQKIPDPQQGLAKTIRNAIEGYDTRVRWIVLSTVAVVLLFLGLCKYGYSAIFAPLRQLHSGARRVAAGDFDYRVRLKRVTTDDEIHELADAFNQMTARFQEIERDLNRQVEERSRQLVRSERLAGIGFLAAGVAHEINNPLSAIAMAAESLELRAAELLANVPDDDRDLATKYLAMIQREAFRCQQITRRLLDFARGHEETRSRFDLCETVREVLEMVGHMARFQTQTVRFNPSGTVNLEGNGPEIKQVVLNLVANSLEALDESGTLDIEIEETDRVAITFRDNGCGMTPDVVDHLFEPFFTKRRGGKGTGLGLSISHRIVTDHGGTIEASSDGVGCGSTFRICLPKRAALAQAA